VIDLGSAGNNTNGREAEVKLKELENSKVES